MKKKRGSLTSSEEEDKLRGRRDLGKESSHVKREGAEISIKLLQFKEE